MSLALAYRDKELDDARDDARNVPRRIAQVEDEVDADGSWAVSYGDMITLLLTFFIVFFTIDPRSAEKEQTQKMRMSLVETLRQTSKNDTHQGVQPELTVGNEQLKIGIDRQVLKKWGGVVHDRGHYVLIEFPGVSFFNSAKTDITQKGKQTLEEFVRVYVPYAANYRLGIRAFADRRQVMRSKKLHFKDNLELTALRSVSAMRVLQKSGIPLSRIKLGGYGEMLVTAHDLESIPAAERSPHAELDLARTVVLVI